MFRRKDEGYKNPSSCKNDYTMEMDWIEEIEAMLFKGGHR